MYLLHIRVESSQYSPLKVTESRLAQKLESDCVILFESLLACECCELREREREREERDKGLFGNLQNRGGAGPAMWKMR